LGPPGFGGFKTYPLEGLAEPGVLEPPPAGFAGFAEPGTAEPVGAAGRAEPPERMPAELLDVAAPGAEVGADVFVLGVAGGPFGSGFGIVEGTAEVGAFMVLGCGVSTLCAGVADEPCGGGIAAAELTGVEGDGVVADVGVDGRTVAAGWGVGDLNVPVDPVDFVAMGA
jgi:hypothetical protein